MDSTSSRPNVEDNSSLFYCGCLACCASNQRWRSRATWYRHKQEREKQIREGLIPPPDPSNCVPSNEQTRKRKDAPARGDDDVGPLAKRAAPMQPTTRLEPPMEHIQDMQHPDLDVPQASCERERMNESLTDSASAGARNGSPSIMESTAGLSSASFQSALLEDLFGLPASSDTRDAGVSEVADPMPDPSSPQNTSTAPTGIPVFDTAQDFINILQDNPRLEDSVLDPAVLAGLRNPSKEPAALSADERLSVRLFLADTDGSDDIYNAVRSAILERHPEDNILTLHLVKKKIAELTGIHPMKHDMCTNSCMAYTGQWQNHEDCRYCQEPRYEPSSEGSPSHTLSKRKPRRQFDTFPFGPQVQARFRSSEGAQAMRFRQRAMEQILRELQETGGVNVIEDVYGGADFWDAVQQGRISDSHVCLLFSMDGAQLYEHKASNCWIYIWILLDVSPDKRYKKRWIMPGAIIPGPNKPKNADSFLFPGFHHIAALQNEGFMIWDAFRDICFLSRPYVFLAEADAIGAPDLTGFVSHHGKFGCRYRCGRPGRRKPGGSHYYSVCLKPEGYMERGCEHDDLEPSDIPNSCPAQYARDLEYLRGATSLTNYEARRLDTGIAKPSLFSGLSASHCLPIPRLFPGDIMHLFGLNIPDLFYKLWHGSMDCDVRNGDNKATWDWVCLVGDVWAQHGEQVAAARHFLPGSFDRPPRNPAEKISSGYKCWEFLNWFYGLAPGLLYNKLPDRYWRHYCKLVAGVRIVFQRRSVAAQRQQAHTFLTDFAYEYEELYVQRKISRMHFVPQCMHAVPHTPTETYRIGSLICTAQFAMERTIGDLGQEIRQPSNPFANLSQRALRRARVNGLKAMLPDLVEDSTPKVPILNLGDSGFALLHPREERPKPVADDEDILILQYIEQAIPQQEDARELWVEDMACCVRRWGRCRLPNGQICRTTWKEVPKKMTRIARNVKYRIPPSRLTSGSEPVEAADSEGSEAAGASECFAYAEVQYYFSLHIYGEDHALALIWKYGPPNKDLLEASHGVVWACRKLLREGGLHVIRVEDICTCVAMIPSDSLSYEGPGEGPVLFAVDKLGIDVGLMFERNSQASEEDNSTLPSIDENQ